MHRVLREVLIGTLCLTGLYGCAGPTASVKATQDTGALGAEVVKDYAAYVHASYSATTEAAKGLQGAIDAFVATPSAAGLEEAKAHWVKARVPYGKTEVFRFYEGPIDAPGGEGAAEGPEGRLNAWPLNEAYLDGVKGNPTGGLIHMPEVPMTREALLARNATEDEAEVTLGWHAIEFMLWGQDHAADGPGARPWEDFEGADEAPTRRRAYLALVAKLLVEDLEGLVAAWAPGGENYACDFTSLSEPKALGHIMTAMATLSGFELGSERIAVPLDSRSQEDEHSCFSDTTHQDIWANAAGIYEVYMGDEAKGHTGVHALAMMQAPKEAKALEALISESTALAKASPQPIDQALIAPDNDPRRAHLEKLVSVLQRQAEAFKALGQAMDVAVHVHAE